MHPKKTSILDHIGRTPLVALDRLSAAAEAPLLGKCEFLNPGGSVKDRIALAIVKDAESRGLLRPGATLVEATAGNTGIGLALVAAVRGYRLACVLPEKMSHDKRSALAMLGARIIMTDNAPPDDPRNFQQVARRLAAENGWFLVDQFANPANVRIHEETTGPEILEQTGGRIGALVAGVGTGGTITGAGRFLKRHVPGVKIILAEPVGSRLGHLVSAEYPDLDAAYQVEGIGGSVAPANFDPGIVDHVEYVSDEDSFAMVGRLLREEGLLVGATSGTVVTAALRAQSLKLDGPLVAILADSWDRYFSRDWLRQLATLGA
jgi:cysteine synthase